MDDRHKVNAMNSSGFSLIEVLVTIVVIALGFLGIASLSVQAARFSVESKHLEAVTQLSEGLADRIRANSVGVANGDYDIATTAVPATCDLSGSGNLPTSATDCTGTDCTPAQLAAFDLNEFRQEIVAQLPGAIGTVEVDASDVVTIAVNWQERTTDVQGNTTFDDANAVFNQVYCLRFLPTP